VSKGGFFDVPYRYTKESKAQFMLIKRLLTVFFLVLCASAIYCLDDIELHHTIEMANTTRSAPPVRRHRSVLFTYHQRSYVRYVGIAFDFENYQVIHPFKKNQHNVFVLLYGPPEDSHELRYRLVVDGLWMPDPRNPDQVMDHRGNLLSRFMYTLPKKTVSESPVVKSDGTVEFNLRYAVGSRIYLTGDFTNWEPFMIEMKEVSPGLYTFSRRFPPGSYEYCFIAGGSRMTDPLNPFFGTDSHGYLASKFTVR